MVVGNPPHFADEYFGELRADDPDWRIHRSFFNQVSSYLKPGGIVGLQENSQGSTAETFREMIEQVGLEIVFVEFGPKQRTPQAHFYFIGIARRGDSVPPWAIRASVVALFQASAARASVPREAMIRFYSNGNVAIRNEFRDESFTDRAGNSRTQKTRFTQVLVKTGDRWLVVDQHNSRVPPPPGPPQAN